MRKIWEDYRWILATAVGSTIFALGFSLFLQPNEISPGGISGLALVAVELLGYGSVGVLTIIINLPLFILGGVKIGRRFFCGSLLGMILSSILIDAFAKVAMPPMDSLLCALYGGMICGLGLGMVFICGTSTGGSDIVVRLLKLKYRDVPIGQISMCFDAGVAVLTGIVFQDITKALYTGVAVFVTGKVLDAVGAKYDTAFSCTEALLGGCAIDATGTALPDETLRAAEASDAVLLAAVGGPKWDTTDPAKPRPEQGLLGIRKALGLYTNLRPVQIFAALADASTLKPEIVDGVDMMIVRELTGGLYFGRRERFYDEEGCGMDGAAGQRAYDTLEYSEYEIERIARQAFEIARKRRGKVTSVDKANVLETSRLWREIVHRVHDADYADVELEDLLVDNTAMQLINRPADFDVVVTENMFGDILSDEAAQITGSLGMLASASLGDGVALYEPSHGSAPDIAGRGIANPLAQILSVEMMLRYSFGMGEAADDIRRAVTEVLDAGWRTGDIKDAETPVDKVVGTAKMGDLVVEHL